MRKKREAGSIIIIYKEPKKNNKSGEVKVNGEKKSIVVTSQRYGFDAT